MPAPDRRTTGFRVIAAWLVNRDRLSTRLEPGFFVEIIQYSANESIRFRSDIREWFEVKTKKACRSQSLIACRAEREEEELVAELSEDGDEVVVDVTSAATVTYSVTVT